MADLEEQQSNEQPSKQQWEENAHEWPEETWEGAAEGKGEPWGDASGEKPEEGNSSAWQWLEELAPMDEDQLNAHAQTIGWAEEEFINVKAELASYKDWQAQQLPLEQQYAHGPGEEWAEEEGGDEWVAKEADGDGAEPNAKKAKIAE